MSDPTVDWSKFRTLPGSASPAETLRERKKQQTRQLLSDTATELFLARGFDAVRVSEIAEACQVSEKTVFNYFPTKEALLLDRWQTTPEALQAALADPGLSPVDAAMRVLAAELAALTSWMAAQGDYAAAVAAVHRFGALIWSTPSLRAHQHDMIERLTAKAAQALAARSRQQPDDPEPLITATALIGLWSVQFASLRRHLTQTPTARKLHNRVMKDTRQAAELIQTGLRRQP